MNRRSRAMRLCSCQMKILDPCGDSISNVPKTKQLHLSFNRKCILKPFVKKYIKCTQATRLSSANPRNYVTYYSTSLVVKRICLAHEFYPSTLHYCSSFVCFAHLLLNVFLDYAVNNLILKAIAFKEIPGFHLTFVTRFSWIILKMFEFT